MGSSQAGASRRTDGTTAEQAEAEVKEVVDEYRVDPEVERETGSILAPDAPPDE